MSLDPIDADLIPPGREADEACRGERGPPLNSAQRKQRQTGRNQGDHGGIGGNGRTWAVTSYVPPRRNKQSLRHTATHTYAVSEGALQDQHDGHILDQVCVVDCDLGGLAFRTSSPPEGPAGQRSWLQELRGLNLPRHFLFAHVSISNKLDQK